MEDVEELEAGFGIRMPRVGSRQFVVFQISLACGQEYRLAEANASKMTSDPEVSDLDRLLSTSVGYPILHRADPLSFEE